MKTLMILITTVLLAAFAYAQEESKEPKELKDLRAKYLVQLETLKKQLAAKGNVDGLSAVQKEIETVSGKTDAEAAGKEADAGNPATIYANCDDAFTMYLNGKEIGSGGKDQQQFTRMDVSLKKGDIIAVKALDFGGDYGFACVIKFKDRAVATDTKNWKYYTPKNKDAWYDLKGAARKTAKEGTNKQHKNHVTQASGTDCEAIWGESGSTAYLVYEVK